MIDRVWWRKLDLGLNCKVSKQNANAITTVLTRGLELWRRGEVEVAVDADNSALWPLERSDVVNCDNACTRGWVGLGGCC